MISAQRANYILSNVVETRKDCVMYVSPSKEAVVDELKTNTKLTNVICTQKQDSKQLICIYGFWL